MQTNYIDKSINNQSINQLVGQIINQISDQFIIKYKMHTLQLHNHTIVHQIQLKKYRKGWIGNKSKLLHLRDDIPCGFSLCPQHNQQKSLFNQDALSNDNIYVIDSYTLINNTDIIYNCQQLENIIILQSSIEKLKSYNPTTKTQDSIAKKHHNLNLNKYNAFKNFIQTLQTSNQIEKEQQLEQQFTKKSRKVYILADKYHKGIHTSLNNGSKNSQNKMISEENQSKNKIFYNSTIEQAKLLEKTIQWYEEHTKDINLRNLNFYLLTSDDDLLAIKNELKVNLVSLVNFLKTQNSNLLDFMGFQDITNQQQSKKIPAFAKKVHSQHLSQQIYTQKVRQGKLFQGKYMAQKSYFKLGGKMYKMDLQNNRSLFGDVVIIQLADRSEWRKKFKKIQQEQQNEQTDTKNFSTKLESEQQVIDLNLIKYLEQNPDIVPKGRIVAIHKRISKSYCGSLNTQKCVYKFVSNNNSNQMKDQKTDQKPNFQIYEFVPVDNRFPSFYMRTFNIQSLTKKRIMVEFDDWPQFSKYPLCHYVRTIGDQGSNKAQGDIILLQHNVEIKDFTKKAYQCLPQMGEKFSIPPEELKYRIDLRNIDVVSIDPPGCKDIDDALHCIELSNGNLQIGVHIADVSYYVRPDTALDLQARNRCTTVYLVDRRTDMLPKLLTENLCSLRSNVDRLAFSVIWQIDRNSNILSSKYCKTIIRSRRAFTYMQAQQLKDSNDQGNIAKSIRNLNMIAKKLKQKRNQNGALTLASTQVKIKLAEETHSATDVQMYQMVQTNYLIQEFMLLANIAVAERIYQRFPSISILRRHTQPKINDLQTLKQIVKDYGYDFNFNSSKQLAQSLDRLNRQGDEFFNKLIRIMTTRCMNQATYFCSADFDVQEFHHYGLATDFYTHFTSPIRRYADVLVHRLLAAAIDLQPLPNFMINKIKMTKVCQKMNMRNRMARYASRASSDYHTYQFFKDRKNKERGIITSISQDYLTIMLIKYGLQSRIQFSQKQQAQIKQLNKHKKFIKDAIIQGKKVSLFDYLDIEVKVELHGFHKKMILNVCQ